MVKVTRLSACAHRDDSEAALEPSKAQAAAGDESWQQWLDEYQRGEALMVRVEVTVELEPGPPLQITNTGVWLETAAHPPKVEQQLSELIFKDFDTIIRELAKRGAQLDIGDLNAMYVHVELGESIRRAIDDAPESAAEVPESEVALPAQHLDR